MLYEFDRVNRPWVDGHLEIACGRGENTKPVQAVGRRECHVFGDFDAPHPCDREQFLHAQLIGDEGSVLVLSDRTDHDAAIDSLTDNNLYSAGHILHMRKLPGFVFTTDR
jgi:hypothetical protein